MKVLETDRLLLRRLSMEDAEFILKLVNEPSWLRFIGDKGVRNLDDARNYLLKGPLAMYSRFGFGLYHVALKDSGLPIGLCGLIQRDTLPDVDIGFAFFPGFWSQGYGYEAASAVLAYGARTFGLKRIVAITSLDNHSSIKLLERLGLTFERLITLSEGGETLRLFARGFAGGS
ncbi:GNAT family N-acetyltransferase [Stigmatella erecta]|uniref:Protein N-acetyltransferase, RimJ/RimL family n=1 Tax=Stigmatella erecta TaxID=83460 RepID=A0A1I0IN25_9BACT|nr:GNAT family N-acetyltransferase [Stigmatella erecta]SET97795.1 Protein N-acetyltransferase, RimJ/RimL family [Stigmatella erecta]